MVNEKPAPLDGIRVLDLTRFVSGSYASQLLAGMGAEVIKVEVPPRGDPYRNQGAVRLGSESVLFMTLNTAKKSVALDFRSPDAAPNIERLVASADVILENARPGSLARYGLDFATIHERHPGIVYGSISGYGDVGPDATRGGFDLTIQAESGLMSVTGHPESGPAKVGAPMTDVGAGLACAAGVLGALLARTTTGIGGHVSTSLLEFALSSLATLATAAFVTGEPPGPLGTHSPNFAPYGAFRAADGWIVLAGAGSDDLWLRLCDALDLGALVDDSRFVDNASRVENRADLTDIIEQRTGGMPTDHWLAILAGHSVPAARIADLGEAFATDQAVALGIVEEHELLTGELFATVGLPLRADGVRLDASSRAPQLGEHTVEVLTALGATDEELAVLVAEGVAIT